MDGAINNLRAKGYKDSEIVIGSLGEAAAQKWANSVKCYLLGSPAFFENTDKIKTNAMGYIA